jgi:predicted phosphodiesterase
MRARVVLLAGLVLGSLLSSTGGQSVPAGPSTAPATFRYAVLADTHIAQPAELARFRQFLYTIQDSKVDFLLMLGDICGHAPEYLPQIREVIDQSGLKVYVIPGNHDDNYGKNPEWYATAFPTHFSFEHKGWRFVMNDSQVPPPAEWLRQQLPETGDQPVVYCQHYPPTSTQTLAEEPWAELAKHTNIRLVLFGHEHSRRSGQIGPVRYEVLNKCFLTGEDGIAHFYILQAGPDGKTDIQEFPLEALKLREPSDALPIVEVKKPHSGDILRNGAVFAGTARDDKGLRRVEYSVDWGAWQPAKGTASWAFRLKTQTLADGHHLFKIRAIDSTGQPSIKMGTVLAMVENHRPRNKYVHRFQQGVDGYDGGTDATVRQPNHPKSPSGEAGETSDLECWTSKDGKSEFSEFYIRFDLAHARIPEDASLKRVTLTVFGSRQNQIDENGRLCGYLVGVMQGPWKSGMSLSDRPGTPAWRSPLDPVPMPALVGTWPYLDGRQLPMPPQPIRIDLTPIRETLQQWLHDPATNHGLVFSPAGGRAYNMSAKGNGCSIATLRPQLEIEVEPPQTTR